MRVLICGDRNWSDYGAVLEYVRSLPKDTVVIEGEANGADIMARTAAESCGLEVLRFPADWVIYGRAAGPVRNRLMLTEGQPDEVHAFHTDIFRSKGTKNMLMQAFKAGKPCFLHNGQGVSLWSNPQDHA